MFKSIKDVCRASKRHGALDLRTEKREVLDKLITLIPEPNILKERHCGIQEPKI